MEICAIVDIRKIKPFDFNNLFYKIAFFKNKGFCNKILFLVILSGFAGVSSFFIFNFLINILVYNNEYYLVYGNEYYNFITFFLYFLLFSISCAFILAVGLFIDRYYVIKDADLISLHNMLKNKPVFYKRHVSYLFKKQNFILNKQYWEIKIICFYYDNSACQDTVTKINHELDIFNDDNDVRKNFDYLLNTQGFLTLEQMHFFKKEIKKIKNKKIAEKIKQDLLEN